MEYNGITHIIFFEFINSIDNNIDERKEKKTKRKARYITTETNKYSKRD